MCNGPGVERSVWRTQESWGGTEDHLKDSEDSVGRPVGLGDAKRLDANGFRCT